MKADHRANAKNICLPHFNSRKSALYSQSVQNRLQINQKMIRARIPGLVCLLLLCVILALGLWPFHRPKNEVAWLGDDNGLHFGGYGTIWSSGTFQMAGSQDEASCSLEIWLQPGLTSDSNTFLAFSTPENPLQFSLHQYLSNLILERDNRGDRHRAGVIGIEGIFNQTKSVFITITSGTHETAIYVDGALARAFPGFRLGKDFTGQLVIGTSPVATDGWPGQLRGLAVYHQELTAEQVLKHYETWTTQGVPEVLGNESIAALYLLNERAGSVVNNAVHPGINLYIPKRFSLLHQVFLKPFWREYEPGWGYWIDILLNVVAFIPLGFFFCSYWSSVRPIIRPALAATVLGLAVSLTIEILQAYLPTRSSGTTDLFTNSLGTFLGVKLYCSQAARTLLARIHFQE
jgi:VanZ family protein